MGTVSTELSPMAKISLIGIWIETVLYGVNCVMYGLCMFVLLRGKTASLRWVLLVSCTALFVLGTAHVVASLLQLLDAFINVPPDVPDYSTAYWLDFTTVLRVLKDILYDTLVPAQYIILTWRLYVVFLCNWRVVVFPIILAVGGTCSVYAASAVFAFPSGSTYEMTTTLRLLAAAWVFGCLHNLCVTGAIVARLWWLGRRMGSLTGTPTNRFASSVYIVIESGAISAVCDTVLLVMFASSSNASFSCLDVVAQMAILTPFLMIVQASTTSRYRTAQVESSKTTSRTLGPIIFRAGASAHQESSRDLAPETTLAQSQSSVSDTHV